MEPTDSGSETITQVLARLRDGGLDTSQLQARTADRLLRRAEPAARAVCRAAARSLPDSQVEELVQDTLELVWRRLPTYESTARFESWVRAIARNVCSNARRRRRDLLTEDGVIEVESPERDALRLLRQDERERIVTDAIEAALDSDEQDVVYHRYLHDLDREQIAELVGLPDADAVRVVLQRASRRLRVELARRLESLGHGTSLLRTRDS